jgi:ribosomal protein S18 acetylase RimI-like enzyme
LKILKARLDDVAEILPIYEHARNTMLERGNPNQWVNNYPSEDTIRNDIETNTLFICVDDKRIVGCFVLSDGEDPTYSKIYHGHWLDDKNYSVIHRLAILENGKGIGLFCINWCLDRRDNIRIDTHEDNSSMQALLKKIGFKYCGVIKNACGDPRLAFQLIQMA